MPSYKDALGKGSIKGVSGGEGLVFSANIAKSGNHIGSNLTLGVSIGVLPISFSSYKTNTVLGDPINDVAKVANINEIFKAVETALDEEIKSINKERNMLTEGIGKVSREINKIDKKLKSILHMCALNAKRKGKELATYFDKKLNKGKNKMLILNNLRNKLLTRVFAVIKRQQPYVDTHKFAA